MRLEVNDLRTKVLRLTEQITDQIAKVNFFSIMSEKVDLMEKTDSSMEISIARPD